MVPLARLACIRHAASVRPEPGSNSHFKKFEMTSFRLFKIFVSNLLLANWLRFLFGFLHPHTFSETLFSFQSTTSVRLNQTAFIFYQTLKLLSRTFFEFVFRHPLELFISCLTTFKYVTSFFSLLQVLFSFYWFFLCSGFLFKLCRISRSDFINLPYFCSSCKFALSFALIWIH